MLSERLITIFKNLEPNYKSSHYLLAVSGGRDSVVLTDLLAKNNIQFSMAHCNFQLRGNESDKEEEFVRQLAKDLKIPLFIKCFTTSQFAKKEKLSIQEAARKLRYNWFFELLEEQKFTKLITAHHTDDDVETFFINLQRGSGLKGLAAIPSNTSKVFRPLLTVLRSEINNYAAANKILYKEDSSNNSDEYLRNSIRLNLIPYLQQNFANLFNGIKTSLPILKQNKTLFEGFVQEKKDLLIVEKDGIFSIKSLLLVKQKQPLLLLYELIKDFGFSKQVTDAIFASLAVSETKHFYSKHFSLTKSRGILRIEALKPTIEKELLFYITNTTLTVNRPLKLELECVKKTNLTPFVKDSSMQYVDYDKLTFPLTIRKYKTGDKFTPLGMSGAKKLSDFFIDNKYTEAQKQNTWLLVSDNKIVCLLGIRINDFFKLTDSTRNCYRIKFI